MIIEWMMNAGLSLLDTIFGVLGVLPSFPDSVTETINTFIDFLFSGIGLVSIFIDIDMIKILIPIVIAVINMDKVIKLIMFILKKIPFLDIE